MARVEKLSLTLSKEDADWARKLAKSQGKSLSAVVSETIRERRQLQAWKAWLTDSLGDEPLTESEREAARRELDGLAPVDDAVAKRAPIKRRRTGTG